MIYTFAVRAIADEEVIGNLGDFAKKLGTTVCALRDDHQVLDGYRDSNVLVLGLRSRVPDREDWGEQIGQNDLWYYSSDRRQLQLVNKRIAAKLRGLEKELVQSPIISDVHKLGRIGTH